MLNARFSVPEALTANASRMYMVAWKLKLERIAIDKMDGAGECTQDLRVWNISTHFGVALGKDTLFPVAHKCATGTKKHNK